MLSEIVLSKTPRQPKIGGGGISISGLFPCPYALYRFYKGLEPREITAHNELVMEDGKWQEEQSVQSLKKVGIQIENSQLEVVVGRAGTKGHIDGTFELGGRVRLFEHKAMSYERYALVKQRRLEAFPGYKAQVQVYMYGMRLKGFDIDEASFYCKHKDSCEPWDFLVKYDEGFASSLVDWVDMIVLDNWEPQPVLCDLCSDCGFNCFGVVLDMSRISIESADEAVDKWKKGKQLQAVGSMLEDEARAFLIGIRDKEGGFIQRGLIGEKDSLFVGGLKVSKVVMNKFSIDRGLVLQEFKAEGLIKVGKEQQIIAYQIREVS